MHACMYFDSNAEDMKWKEELRPNHDEIIQHSSQNRSTLRMGQSDG